MRKRLSAENCKGKDLKEINAKKKKKEEAEK